LIPRAIVGLDRWLSKQNPAYRPVSLHKNSPTVFLWAIYGGIAMIANYHTHTMRCNHGFGSDEDFVLAAIDGGLQILGFSDHTPYFFPGDYYTHMRMAPEELEGYVSSILSLREKYKDQIQIHLGLEVEYYPQLFDRLRTFARDAGIEYMILAQHWCGNEIGEKYTGHFTTDIQHLERYCNQTIEAMETGKFTYFAHPDVLNYDSSTPEYRENMHRLCEAAKRLEVPLEINLLGLRTNRHYPNESFWKIAGEVGCLAILGSDAHRPEDTIHTETILQAQNLIEKYGLTLLDTVPLRRITDK